MVLAKLIYMDVDHDDILNVAAEALHMIFLDVTPTNFAGILVGRKFDDIGQRFDVFCDRSALIFRTLYLSEFL